MTGGVAAPPSPHCKPLNPRGSIYAESERLSCQIQNLSGLISRRNYCRFANLIDPKAETFDCCIGYREHFHSTEPLLLDSV